MRVEGKAYDAIVKEYKSTLRSLIEEFKEAIELRKNGELTSIFFTMEEMRFLKKLLEDKEDELDGRC